MYSIIRFGLLYGFALVIGFVVSHLILVTDSNNFTAIKIVGVGVGVGVMIISLLALIMDIKEYKQNARPLL
jgi:pantothenate kinase